MSRLRDSLQSPGLRVFVYYTLIAVLLWLVAALLPWFRQLLIPISGATAEFGDALNGQLATQPVYSVRRTALVGVIAVLGAVAFAAPVVWIYMVIMRQDGYDKSFVRMLSGLPVVVAGVVQVVRGDLSLAFALAGIVAAVRFRTTVKDLQDAVFAFAAIGVGLAAGTGNFTLAWALAFVFSMLAYVLWRTNVGDVEPSLELTHTGVQLSEALVPGETHRAVVIGDEDVVEPVHAHELDNLAESIETLADYVRADALRKKKKYNTLMLVYSSDSDTAYTSVSPILQEHTSRFVHVETIERPETAANVCVYLLRLKKTVDVGELVEKIQANESILAVEMKPIKGLRKRLT